MALLVLLAACTPGSVARVEPAGRPPALPAAASAAPVRLEPAPAPSLEPAAVPAGAIHGRVLGTAVGPPLADTVRVAFALPTDGDAEPAPEPIDWRRAGDRFEPHVLAVRVGQTITIRNEEQVCHRFFSSSPGMAFDLELLHPGMSCSLVFDRPGIAHVYCSLHGGKQATVVVVPSRYHGFVGPDGAFTFETPAGDYVVDTVGEGLASRPRHASVMPATTEVVDLDCEPALAPRPADDAARGGSAGEAAPRPQRPAQR